MNHLAILSIFLSIIGKSTSSAPSQSDAQQQVCTTPDQCTAPLTSVYVIGDLHGDVLCAVSWVNRTGLISNLFDPVLLSNESLPLYQRLNLSTEWIWTNEHKTSTLIFMGDYVDKGPTSKQTIEFVRDLTLQFPEKVTALLGNHELELLRDRDSRIEPEGRYGSYSYASVHPGEYHNYFHDNGSGERSVETDATTTGSAAESKNRRSLDSKDEVVLNLLYEASMEVYSFGAHNAVRFVPSVPAPNNNERAMYAITDLIPPEHRELAQERLGEYQNAYFDAYRSGTPLGSWLESRPIIHYAENINTLFVHGGVHPNIGKAYLNKGHESINKINSIWHEHSTEDKLFDFLNSASWGQVAYSLLTHRGNHPGYSKWESHGHVDDNPDDRDAVCVDLDSMLTDMPGIERIAVGHTPDFNVRFYCNDKFLALDSMLGRGIRAVGNEYCPWHGHDMKGVPKVSRNGKYKCDDIPGSCNGETVRLDSDGSIHILNL